MDGNCYIMGDAFSYQYEFYDAICDFKKWGYGGVDIFIFASGIGNYYSYLNDEKIVEFMKRRISRLAYAYIPVIVVWCIYSVINNKLNPLYILGNILGIQGFSSSGSNFNWYISAILFFYLLAPYLATCIRDNSRIKNVILIVILLMSSTAFIGDSHFIIAITRLPIFALGMIFAKNEGLFVKRIVSMLFISFVIGFISLVLAYKYADSYLWNYGLHWYPFFFMTPFICVTISQCAMFCEKNKVDMINKFFMFIGSISFELFLIHIIVFDLYKTRNIEDDKPMWAAIVMLSVVGALLYSKILKRFRKVVKAL